MEIHQLRTWRSGSFRHIDLHLAVPRYQSIDEAHQTGDELEGALMELVGGTADVVVHLDPCRPRHCSACTMEACPVRSEPLRKPFDFSIGSLTKPGTI